jgi:hypothetical protein
MKYLSVLPPLVLSSLLGACGTNGVTSTSVEPTSLSASAILSPATTHDTILLVSLDNGSVIMQTIKTSADLCFKKNSDSSTTCLTQGEPVIDPATDTVIGFEMIENHIELIADSD